MKQFCALGMAVVMMAGAVTGCGGKQSGKAEAGGLVQVDFWYSGGKTAVSVVQGIVDEFNSSQNKYHVNTVTQADYDETYQKLQAGIAGKKAPDLALLDTDKAKSLADKKIVADLSSMIANDSEFQKDDYLEVFFNQGISKDGSIYALPAYGTTQVMYYNIEAFKKAGVQAEEIKTWQDLAEVAKAIKATGEFKYGWEPMWGADNLIDAAFSNGGSIFSEDGKTVTINSPEWVEVWESIRTWIHDDKTMAIHSGGQGWEYWYNTIDDVLNNTAGGYTGSSGDQADLDFTKVAAMEQPAWDENSTSAPMAEALQLVTLTSSSEEEKQGAYEFMKYFTSAKSQSEWSMKTGYVAVRNSVNEVEEYAQYIKENPQASVPLAQASHGSIYPDDPTGGKIYDALKIAADKVEIEGKPAKEALDEAQKTAQAALDAVQ